MATPTDEQQLRATLRRHARANGDTAAIALAVRAMSQMFPGAIPPTTELPPLMGAAEAADVLGMKATNLKRLSPPLPVAAVISGRIPVYRQSDVMEAKARRDARRAAA